MVFVKSGSILRSTSCEISLTTGCCVEKLVAETSSFCSASTNEESDVCVLETLKHERATWGL